MEMLNNETIKTVEFWKDVVGYKGYYQVSTFGNVRSLNRKIWGGKIYYTKKGMILNNNKSDTGYLFVILSKKSTKKTLKIHKIMEKAFPCWFIGEGNRVDHIDRDKDNCNISNLRRATAQQNQFNRCGNLISSSKYKGVSWDKDRKKWSTKIGLKGKTFNIGRFEDEVEAAQAYDRVSLEHFKEFAYQNFPKEVLLV